MMIIGVAYECNKDIVHIAHLLLNTGHKL